MQHQHGPSHLALAVLKKKKKKKSSRHTTNVFVPNVSLLEKCFWLRKFISATFLQLNLESSDRNRELLPVPSFSTTRGASTRHMRHDAFAATKRLLCEATIAEKNAGQWRNQIYSRPKSVSSLYFTDIFSVTLNIQSSTYYTIQITWIIWIFKGITWIFFFFYLYKPCVDKKKEKENQCTSDPFFWF